MRTNESHMNNTIPASEAEDNEDSDSISSCSEKLPLVSVILATYNERDNIGQMIEATLENIRQPVEIIVVDDNSPDGTADYVRGLENPDVILILRLRERGLASAVARGVMESKGEIIGWIDADMPGEAKNLSNMVELTKVHDVVIASRFVAGGGDTRHFARTLASRLINGFAKAVLGYGINDYGSCVAMVRRNVFDDVMIIPYGFGDFFIEFVYGCCKKGFMVHEMPYHLLSREGGASKSFPSIKGFLWLGSKYVIRVLAARFRPD